MFFVELGRSVGSLDSEGPYLRVVISVPTRGYAVALLAFGIALSQYQKRDSHSRAIEHFRTLCSLPSGTPVILTIRKKRFYGDLDGVTHYAGVPHIRVRIQNARGGNLTYWIKDTESQQIVVARDPHPLPEVQKGRSIRANSCFLQEVHSAGLDVGHYTSARGCDSLLIGSLDSLRKELVETTFGLLRGNGVVQGAINDVIRAFPYLPHTEGHRSRVFPGRQQAIPEGLRRQPWHTVLYDGSRSYLKWAAEFRSHHAVAVLDPSDRLFNDAVMRCNQAYIHDRIDAPLPSLPDPPPGVESIAFREVGDRGVEPGNG